MGSQPGAPYSGNSLTSVPKPYFFHKDPDPPLGTGTLQDANKK